MRPRAPVADASSIFDASFKRPERMQHARKAVLHESARRGRLARGAAVGRVEEALRGRGRGPRSRGRRRPRCPAGEESARLRARVHGARDCVRVDHSRAARLGAIVRADSPAAQSSLKPERLRVKEAT